MMLNTAQIRDTYGIPAFLHCRSVHSLLLHHSAGVWGGGGHLFNDDVCIGSKRERLDYSRENKGSLSIGGMLTRGDEWIVCKQGIHVSLDEELLSCVFMHD